jgi:hypothetical protein
MNEVKEPVTVLVWGETDRCPVRHPHEFVALPECEGESKQPVSQSSNHCVALVEHKTNDRYAAGIAIFMNANNVIFLISKELTAVQKVLDQDIDSVL